MAHPSRNQNRQAVRDRKRTELALASDTIPVAFKSTPDAHRIDGNANKGKRSAARMAPVTRLTANTGRRKRNETIRQPWMATSFARIPSLGETLSKRPLR